MDQLEMTIKQGEELFTKRSSLLNLWQLFAEHFYPERADFNGQRALGEEFGADLMSSYPVLIRRDLGDSLSSILRPTNKEWMHTRIKTRWDKVGVEGRTWLEWTEGIQRRAMYDKNSGFMRATKQGDHDFATFGQAVIQPSLNRNADGLLYRCWHLRDVVWLEDENGKICVVFRKATPKVRDMVRWFPKTVHTKIREKLEKKPFDEIPMWHVVLPSDMWSLASGRNRHPYVSVYIDPENKHLLEEKPSRSVGYVIPRWSTVSGSQYATSPATTIAYADARMLQAMIGVLLEAGEKAVNPPMVANKDIFGGSFSIFPGGTTWADFEQGGRIQDHFQVLPQDKSGIPFGLDMANDVKTSLRDAFFLDKLSLPPPGQDMTAYEVGQRVQEYIRQAMPLFEPIEQEYNGPLCEETFDLLFYAGAFGSVNDIPKELRGEKIEFTFESPLHDALDKAKSQKFLEAKSLIAESVDQDPTVVHIMDFKKALRDVLKGAQTPAAWLRTEAEAQARADDQEQAAIDTEELARMQQAADVAQTISETGGEESGGLLAQ